jgi:hypothetical protein
MERKHRRLKKVASLGAGQKSLSAYRDTASAGSAQPSE